MKVSKLTKVLMALVLTLSMAQAAHAITKLGNHPYYQPPLETVGDLYTMIAESKDDLKMGLDKAGAGAVYDSFMDQVGTVEIKPVDYQKGQVFDWMFFRTRGQGPVKVADDVVWEGEGTVPAFEFDIEHEGQLYTFGVPLICGNLSLISMADAPVAAAVAPEPEPVVEAEPAGWPIIADLGIMYLLDPGTFILGRVGTEYYFNDNWSVVPMIGTALQVHGEDGVSAILADVFLNYNTDSKKCWAGLGLGGWFSIDGDSDLDSEDSDLDLIFNTGTRIWGEPEGRNASLFLEVRSAVDEFSDFDLYGRIGGGLRFRF